MQDQKPQAIRKKQRIPSEVRTPGKDAAADYIEEEVLSEGRWPIPYTVMSEESGWSRQHIRSTVEDYFLEVDPDEQPEAKTDGEGVQHDMTIRVPEDVDRRSYLRGWIDGNSRW